MDRKQLENMRTVLEAIKIGSGLSAMAGAVNCTEFIRNLTNNDFSLMRLIATIAFFGGSYQLFLRQNKLDNAIEEEALHIKEDELNHKRKL